MAELGYHRSAKKCKEKFENVYKYHKRTKEGRAAKPDGKTYRFFDQLEALDAHPSSSLPPSQQVAQPPRTQTTVAASPITMPAVTATNVAQTTVSSTTTNPSNISMTAGHAVDPSPNITPPPPLNSALPTTASMAANTSNNPMSLHNVIQTSIPSASANPMSNSSSYSTSTDEEFGGGGRRKKKRKWEEFFERLMNEVIEKQEQLQKRFLEAIEKREHDRMVREEAWKMQEMARMNREHEILVQERSIAAAKDAALIAFLQKMSDQSFPVQLYGNAQPTQQQQQQPQAQTQTQAQAPQQQQQQQRQTQTQPQPQPQQQQQQQLQLQPVAATIVETQQPSVQKGPDNPKTDSGDSFPQTSSSRWPKAEVQALIRFRTSLDLKYQESGPKGPLWEEISASMRKLGYNRNAKRCKEKWENINKYFKKVKESNKKRPEDSKTCPYFHQLDALYRERNKSKNNNNSFNPNYVLKPENPMIPIMARPEQQWPLHPQDHQQQQHQPDSGDIGSDNMGQHHENAEDDDDEDVGDEEEEEEEGDEEERGGGGGGGYEIVANKPSSIGAVE